MRAKLHPYFGTIPPNSDNLEVVGSFLRRFDEKKWATIWPESGLIKWANGTFEIETIWSEQNLKNCGDYRSKWRWFPHRRYGRYFNLSLFWSFGYYHWICDVLTRLHTMLPRLSPDIRIILPPHMKAWQSRSLELIGLAGNQLLAYTGRRPWKVENLSYASPVAMTGDHEEKSLFWVRDTIWQRCLGRIPNRGGRKFYLLRHNTWSRNVTNESELLIRLAERGYEALDCGTLTFDEQVRIFSEASHVVGPHGAALTNLLWSPPGCKVFEFFEPATVRRCYWSMCKTLEHHYACGIGEAVPQEKKEANIRVPVGKLIESLDQLGF
jgi:capsular polysaccharide biosynthesis protein